jgi:hypothetical protein
MFSFSSIISGRSMRYVCPFTQWKLNSIPFHHHTIAYWIVMMRSQSQFVLWKILSDIGLLATVDADSLSHKNCTDHICMVPARNNITRAASLATSPRSSNQ